MRDPYLSQAPLRAGKLDCDMALRVVRQALVMLEQTYVHRWQKEAMHAIAPMQRLRLLLAELEGTTPSDMRMTDHEFHRRMANIFLSLRDRHTTYLLPEPYASYIAYLPILIEGFEEKREPKFVVARVGRPRPPDPSFVEGVEILYWNGIPIRRAIEVLADRQPAGNRDARFALALQALTVRPLARSLPPDEDWVQLTYRARRGAVRDVRLKWRVHNTSIDRKPNAPGSAGVRAGASAAVGLDFNGSLISEMRRELFGRHGKLKTKLPDLLRACPIHQNRYGYLRIFSFDAPSADGFVDEVRSLLERLPKDGLIIDIRGNPGGNIAAAERLLQLFTPRRVQPAPMQFVNSPATLRLCDRHAATDVPGLLLAPWKESIASSVQTGAQHSAAFPITDEFAANDVGQCYYGPVLLITDPFCYSAAELFAAGFQDHGIGEILGIGLHTGGGGANVWSHGLITTLLAGGNGFESLRGAAGMTVAIRRSLRVGPNNRGEVLEDFGVSADHIHTMTRRDVLDGNVDLIEKAIERLESMSRTRPPRILHITHLRASGGGVSFALETRKLRRVDVFLDNRAAGARTVRDGPNRLTAAVDGAPPRTLRVVGFASLNSGQPVAAAMVRV